LEIIKIENMNASDTSGCCTTVDFDDNNANNANIGNIGNNANIGNIGNIGNIEPVIDEPYIPNAKKINKRVIDWNELSKLGLIYKINSEVLHPHGLALFRDNETGISGGAIVGDEPYTYSEDSIKNNTEKLKNLESNILELRKNINKKVNEDDLEYINFYNDTFKLFKLWKEEEAEDEAKDEAKDETKKTGPYVIYKGINYIKYKYEKAKNGVSKSFPNLLENPTLETSLDFIDILTKETISVLTNIQKHKMINFEGIDASGKETISTLFKQMVNEFLNIGEMVYFLIIKYIDLIKIKNLCEIAKHGTNYTLNRLKYFKDDFETIKVNIPNYENETGKQIKELLHADDSLNNIQPLKYLFAINRLETQNYLNNLVKRRTSLEYFDRWVDSSVAFTLAKFMYNEMYNEMINGMINGTYNEMYNEMINGTINGMINGIINKIINKELIEKTMDLRDEIYSLEYNTLNLKIPDLTILCTAPIQTIAQRLNKRSLTQALDTHEQNLDFLNFTQLVYKAIFGLPLNCEDKDLEYELRFLISPVAYRPKTVIQLDTSSGTPEECVRAILENL